MDRYDEIGEILDRCLDLLRGGQVTIESLIEKYPEYQEALKPPLEAAAWLQGKALAFSLSPGFVASSRRRLVERFRNREVNDLGYTLHVLGNPFISFTEVRAHYGNGVLSFLVVVVLLIGYRNLIHPSLLIPPARRYIEPGQTGARKILVLYLVHKTR
jgi:hypothetical protein